MSRFFKASVVASCLIFSAFAQAETYIVKKGDTLASIARARYGEPVFGPKGTIKKIYKLNPWAKSNPALEPGQKIEIEGGKKEAPAAGEPEVKMIPATPAASAAEGEIPTSEAKLMSPAERAAHEMDLQPKGPLPEEKKPVAEAAAKEQVIVHEPEPEHEHAEAAVEPEHEHHTHNYFSVTPNYSFVTQSATENASGQNFAMHSNPAWGVELGWDHWWNDTFSTVLTYAFTQITSKETSEMSGDKVLKGANLNRTELALLNRVVHWMRLGAGAAYGDHIFLEDFSTSPSQPEQNPQVYKMSFFNAFLMAEITAHESEHYEWLVNLKISELPAQVGFGHDVNNGVEWFGQVAMMQKLSRFSMFYGLSYASENQTRTDAKETRNETALKVGVFF